MLTDGGGLCVKEIGSTVFFVRDHDRGCGVICTGKHLETFHAKSSRS